MNRKRMTLGAPMTLGLALILGGCGDSDPQKIATPTPPPLTGTCSASLGPSTFHYAVTPLYELHLTDAGGTTTTLRRKSHGADGRLVYGGWILPSPPVDPSLPSGFTLEPVLDIEPTEVTVTADCSYPGHAITAMVSSPATVSDTTFTILQREQDVENF